MNFGTPTSPPTSGTGTDGTIQMAGNFATRSMTADGYTSGFLSSLETDSTGRITGVFTNGQRRPPHPPAPAHRRYNVVWYRPADEQTKLQWLLTDETGVTHSISIPPPPSIVSGWLIGGNDALRELPVALSLYDTRNLIAAYLAEPGKRERSEILRRLTEQEAATPAMAARRSRGRGRAPWGA